MIVRQFTFTQASTNNNLAIATPDDWPIGLVPKEIELEISAKNEAGVETLAHYSHGSSDLIRQRCHSILAGGSAKFLSELSEGEVEEEEGHILTHYKLNGSGNPVRCIAARLKDTTDDEYLYFDWSEADGDFLITGTLRG